MFPTKPPCGKYGVQRVSAEARIMVTKLICDALRGSQACLGQVKIARSKYFQQTITRQTAPLNCQAMVRHFPTARGWVSITAMLPGVRRYRNC